MQTETVGGEKEALATEKPWYIYVLIDPRDGRVRCSVETRRKMSEAQFRRYNGVSV